MSSSRLRGHAPGMSPICHVHYYIVFLEKMGRFSSLSQHDGSAVFRYDIILLHKLVDCVVKCKCGLQCNPGGKVLENAEKCMKCVFASVIHARNALSSRSFLTAHIYSVELLDAFEA